MRLEMPAVASEIARAQAAIVEFCEQAGLESRLVDDVRLSVGEVCSNCVEHASREADGVTMTLEARVEGRALLVAVSDDGGGLTTLCHASADSRVEMGRGLRSVAQLATGVDVVFRRGRGTRVSMRFLSRPD